MSSVTEELERLAALHKEGARALTVELKAGDESEVSQAIGELEAALM